MSTSSSSHRSGRTVAVYAALLFAVVMATAASAAVNPEASAAREQQHQRLRRSISSSSGANQFARIAKALAAAEEDLEGRTDLNDEFDVKRASSFVRIGKSSALPIDLDEAEYQPSKRASSFVRIGRLPYPSSSLTSSQSQPSRPTLDDFHRKRMSSFVRIGKRLNFESAPVVASGDDESQVVGRSGLHQSGFQAASTPNCGTSGGQPCSVRDGDDDSLERPSAAGGAVPEKKASSFIRIGRRSVSDQE